MHKSADLVCYYERSEARYLETRACKITLRRRFERPLPFSKRKDWPDVESLLIAQRGKLDEAYIADWLSQFAEALEKPEILTEYQCLLAQTKALL